MSESSHMDKRETFPTDTEISFDANEEKQPSRKLQKWSDIEKSITSNQIGNYASLDDQNSAVNNWTPQAMFEHHEKKYNFKSTYDELEYTTPLPVASDDQLLKATRMEHEIIREGQHDEEDYDRSEEDLFSKVARPGNKQNYHRPQKHNRTGKKEFERNKREIHPEAIGLPEWRQTAFAKINSNSDDSDIIVQQAIVKTKPVEQPIQTQDEVSVVSEEINDQSSDVDAQLNPTEVDINTSITEKTPSARNKSSVQKKKDAIDYIESHSREEIKKNFISFSHDLTPRICTIAKSNQTTLNANADLTSNSCTNFDILSASTSKSIPSFQTLMADTSSSIEPSEDWDLETADKVMSENTSEHSSIHSQLTPTHSHTQSHDSQDSGVLDSEYPPSTESDNNNELCKQQQKQGSSTLNPQAEEFRFDMSKLSDVILQDPAYLRMLRKGGSQKYSKQPNASMRGRGNAVTASQQRGERPSTSSGGMGGFSKKPDIPSPGSVAKGRGSNESIVGPTGYSTQKRGSRKGGRFRSVKHQGYKPNFEMEQLYALPGSQFQVLTNPNGMFYQPAPMPHLPQTGKPGPIPQPIQIATHHTTQRPSVQSIQAMQNPQMPLPQVSYPGFPVPSQMPEDPQQVPPQPTQILFGPDGIPLTYIPQSQAEFQPYPQPPHGYTQHETPQQYIIPQYLPANSGHPQYGYMPVESQPNQVLYSQYPPQGIIQLQNNSKSNMY